MTDKKEKKDIKEKVKYYLGFITKEELAGFFDRLKKALAEGKKEGEKKNFELEIRGSKDEPKGVTIEQYTLDKAKFAEYFDPAAEHTKKALVICTLALEVKDEKDIEKLKTDFEKIKPMFLDIPPIKARPGKFDLAFRNNGKKVFIDLVSVEGKVIQPLLDLGVNLSEYHEFHFALKTGADLGKIYDEGANPSDDLMTEILNLFVSVKSSGVNIKYLTTALITALKDVKISDEKVKKKFEKFLGYLNLVNAFIGAKVKLEFDSKVLKSEGDKEVKKLPGGAEGVKQQIGQYHAMAQGMGKNMVKPAVDGMGFADSLKALNLDCLSIAGGIPRYENGYAFVLKLPGLTHVLEELLK